MRLLLVSVVSLYFQVRLFLNRNEKNEKLLIGFTCVVDFSVSSAKRYLCVIQSRSQKRIGTRKSSASPQTSVTCLWLDVYSIKETTKHAFRRLF